MARSLQVAAFGVAGLAAVATLIMGTLIYLPVPDQAVLLTTPIVCALVVAPLAAWAGRGNGQWRAATGGIWIGVIVGVVALFSLQLWWTLVVMGVAAAVGAMGGLVSSRRVSP